MNLDFYTDSEIALLLNYSDVRQTLDEALADLASGRASVFPRQRASCGDIKLSAMGGIWQSRGVAGIKSYPTVKGQFSFLISLFDTEDNHPLAMLQANEITRLRTAAMATLVATRAANPAPQKLALIGAGLQGGSAAEALEECFSFSEICVADPAIQPFALTQLASRLKAPVVHCSAGQAVRDADIVVTASRSKTPVFDGAWLKPGCLVIAIGTSLPDGRELDDETLGRAGRVIVEWKPQSMVEAGEVVLGLQHGALQVEKIVDLAEVYRGDHPWRASSSEIVVFKSVGIGLVDVATACLAVEKAGQHPRPRA
jgi:ornithine cyclodeaminase